jgi:hypothetical protein
MKKIQLDDEQGIMWTILPEHHIFQLLARIKITADEYSCWRDHHLSGYKHHHLDEARDRLDELTLQCLEAQEADDDLLKQLVHAARAYTTLAAIYPNAGTHRAASATAKSDPSGGYPPQGSPNPITDDPS